MEVINVNHTNEIGETVLHKAAFATNLELVQTLLSVGADPNAEDVSNCTPLHCAASAGSLPTVQLLLDFGANLMAEDKVYFKILFQKKEKKNREEKRRGEEEKGRRRREEREGKGMHSNH